MKNSPEDILYRGVQSEATEKEYNEAISLFHRDDLEFEIKGKLIDILDNTEVPDRTDIQLNSLFEKFWARIQEKEKEKHPKLKLPLTVLKIAAVLVIGIFIGSLLFSKVQKESIPLYYSSVAPRGSVSQVILPDSTFICLNSGSILKYRAGGNTDTREVFLNGEAWFQVQKSEEKPFIVHTDYYDVTVTGTEFNVKAYTEDANVVTTLEKGSVLVTSGKIRLQEPASLKPGEQLIFNKESRNIFLKTVNTKWFTSWKDNKLVFVNMNLKELMVLLERKYGVEIRTDDPKILNYHYDGTLKNETVLEVLNLLSETLPIQYKINDQVIEIRRK